MFDAEVRQLRVLKPLIHCVTNPVSLNDCANLLLACGASPVMAGCPEESGEITAASRALVLNLGMLNPQRFEVMTISLQAASERKIPVILDPAGADISSYRRKCAEELLRLGGISVIRGNPSEIMALCGMDTSARGTETEAGNVGEEVFTAVHNLSNTTGAIVEITGESDIITDGLRRVCVKGGHIAMTRIMGVGCMLSALTGAFLAVKPEHPLEAATMASALMKRFGEAAALNMECLSTGCHSMRTYLIDAAGRIDFLALQGGFQIEDR